MYYRGASAAVIVYDITKKESFDTMKKWIDELKARAAPGIVLALAGNKIDLEDQRLVTKSDAENYIRNYQDTYGDCPIFGECSAKTGEGVQEIFTQICKKLINLSENENKQ